MKSYLRFLSRNKLYTAIMTAGLSIAMAFAILLGSYVIDETSYDKGVDTGSLYVALLDYTELKTYERKEILANTVGVDMTCSFRQINSDNGMTQESFKAVVGGKPHRVYGIVTEPQFLSIFPIRFIEGNRETALKEIDNVIISESLAKRAFHDGDPLGQELRFDYRGYNDRILTVSGVFKDIKGSTLKSPDVIFQRKDELDDGAVEVNAAYFLKMRRDADIENISKSLNEQFNDDTRFQSDLTIKRFSDIRGCNEEWFYTSFNNTYDKEIINIYRLMCTFIILISVLNYIALTIAFSRFRLKEIATRRILGSGRKGIITRCIAETLVLLCVSSVLAALIAIALKEPVGGILGLNLDPLTDIREYLLIGGIVIISGALAGSIPSMVLSVERPMDVIRGEERHKDRMILSKVFIFAEGALSILSVAITIAIVLQTNEILKRPRGYETDNLTFVSFPVMENVDRYYHELNSLNCIESIGTIHQLPISIEYGMRDFYDEAGNEFETRTLLGDRKGIELLGINFTDEWSRSAVGDTYLYVCEGALQQFGNIIRDGKLYDHKDGFTLPLSGTVSDFTIGNLKGGDEPLINIIEVLVQDDYIPDNPWDNLIIKTIGDENEACRRIREFYRSKGYDNTLFEAQTLNNMMKEQLRKERKTMFLLIIFTAICLLLTAMAIIALSSYHVQISTHSTSVRKVFGISQREVFCNTVRRFLSPVLASAVIAIPLACIYICHWLEAYPLRISNSPLIYLSALAVVMLVAFAAVALQALRLMRTNPAEALKKE